MKLLSSAKLAFSFSLLASRAVLRVASTALSEESSEAEPLVLTADNFESTIADGVWFIEYMSPYCGHCRSFTPTWDQLVAETAKKADPGIHLAQVNCAVHGSTSTLRSSPFLGLIADLSRRALVETFKQARTIELLTTYLDAHAAPPSVSSVSTPKASALTAVDLETNDSPSKDENPSGVVVALDEETFEEAVDEGGVFVNFCISMGYHCRKFAPTWAQLARQIQRGVTIAEVNCQKHRALCQQEGIIEWPMLFYYLGNGRKVGYVGEYSVAELQEFAAGCQEFMDMVNLESRPATQEFGSETLQEVMNAS
ncbi:thioredoxin-like protein [Cubamyces sp. BRFM 1775]|nr:thioredoxin-like protein [Cubamyces sp. BRFM 1775]